MPTLEELISQGRDWECIIVSDIDANQALNFKYNLQESGLQDGEDFVWGYRASEYDGFTMNRPRYAVYAFRDPAVASFFRLKWA